MRLPITPTATSTSTGALASTFVPFALLLSAALLGAETADSLDHGRLLYSSWVSLVFAIPALCLFVFPTTRNGEYERLTWTFSYLAYLVHFYYAFGVTYDASFAKTYAGQGPVIATSNFTLTALWTFDVVASWRIREEHRWLAIERTVVRVLVFATFVMSAVVIFGGFVRVLGISMILAVAICVALRVLEVVRRRRAASDPGQLEADASVG
jgi:hypothetical protein